MFYFYIMRFEKMEITKTTVTKTIVCDICGRIIPAELENYKYKFGKYDVCWTDGNRILRDIESSPEFHKHVEKEIEKFWLNRHNKEGD